MDEITKQLFLEKIRANIEDYKDHADELLKLINIHFKNEPDRLKNISILMIQRYYSGLISLSTLLGKFKFYQPVEFTYALIIRTLLLDFITLEYLNARHVQGENDFINSLSRINYLAADDAERFCSNLTEDKDKEGFRKNIYRTTFPENFSEEESSGKIKLIRIKPIKPWEMASFFKDKKYTYAYDAYQLFNHYSLIAHFNNLTFSAMNGDNLRDIKNLCWSMFYIFHGHNTCLEILDFFPKHSPEIIQKREHFLNLINEI